MADFEKTSLATYEAQWFLEFYNSLRSNAGVIPFKNALKPHALAPVLGFVFILEKLPGGFFFRLFGSKIAEIVGRENTRKYMHETLNGDDLDHINNLLIRCLSMPVIVATTERLLSPGKEWVEVEIIRCPFSDEHGVARFIAGTFNKTGVAEKFSGPKIIDWHDIKIEKKSISRVDIPLQTRSLYP